MMNFKRIFNILFFFISLISYAQKFPSAKELSTGQGSVGSLDPVWMVSELIPLTIIPTNPDIYTYNKAFINSNCAPNSWVNPTSLPAPINNGNWVIANGENCTTNGTPGGYRFFRLKLNLPSLCDGKNITNNYVLYFTGYVDDKIENVYVNGIPKNINGGSYSNIGKINFELKDSWKVGDNFIDVLVKNNPPSSASGPNPYGLLLVADAVKSATSDLDQDGIPDLNDPCPCQKWSENDDCTPKCNPTGITVTTQPSNQTTCAGNNVVFTVNSNSSKYQWKESRDNGLTFVSINDGGVYSGTQTSTLTINSITNNYNGYKYKCIFLNSNYTCKDSTNIASITITPLNTTTKETFEVCEGKSVDIFATNTFSTTSNYVWTVPNGITNPGNVHKVTANTPGIYTVNVFTPTNTNLICNGDFEQPITSSSVSNITNFPCWKNTAEANIEVWKSGYQGVNSQSGNQFIELNANTPGTLYSDLTNLTQGASIDISFAHRGRSGTDVMKVLIGPPLPALESTCTILGTYSTGNAAWKTYSASYTVPTNGNYSLRFISVSSTGGASLGNFIDNVIVKYTASLCANISKEFTVKTIPLPTATISGEASVCKDGTSPTLTFTGSNGTSPYIFTYSINNGANQTVTSTGNTAVLTIPTSSTGTFDYKLISVKEGSTQTCTQNQTGTKSFKVIPVSVGGTLSSNQTICSGNTPNNLTLTGNVGTITKWQSSEAPFNSWTDINNTTTTYSPTTLTTSTKFRVEVKNEVCNPVYSNEITITVDASTVGGSVSSDQSICETVTPNALTLSGHTGQISKWQFSTTPFNTWSDITNVTSSNTLAKLTQTTKYRAVLKSGVCPEAYSQPATITIKSLEKLNVSCGVSSMTDVEFTWSDVSDETSYDYSYTIAGGTPSTGIVSTNITSVSIPVTAQGQTVQITLTPTNATCAQPEIQNCTSITCPTPTTDQISDISVCSGQNVTIPTFNSPNPTTSYTWKVNNTSFSIGNTGTNDIPVFPAPTTNTKITATFSVNAKNAICTGPTMNFKLIINPPPTLNITNDGPICVGTRPIQLNENSGNGMSWSWSTDGSGSFSSTTIQNPTVNNPANGETITVSAKDANNCSNTTTTTLIVNPLPIINAGTDQTICSGNSTTLSGSGALNYSWDNSVVNGVSFSPTDTKTYTLIGTDNNGCKNTDQVKIEVNKTPRINNVNLSKCSGNPFTVSPIDNTNGQIVPPLTKYLWTVSNPINVLGSVNQTIAQNDISATLTNNSSSSETVTYTVTAENGNCKSDFKINATIFPLPEFTPSARSKCINEPLYVKANLSSVFSLNWTGPNGFSQTQSNDNEILVTNAATNTHQGIYTVVGKDLNGCENTKTMNVSIFQLPIINAGTDIKVCVNEAVTLKASGGIDYTWDNSVINGISFLLNSNKTFNVIGKDANGCSNSDQVQVEVNPLPDFKISVNEPCENQDLQFNIDLTNNPSTAGISSSDWSGPNGFTSTSLNAKISQVTTAASGLYSITFKDNNSCTSSKSINAVINPLDIIQFNDIDVKCVNDAPFLLPVPNIIGGTWSSDITSCIQNPNTGLFDPTKSKIDQEVKVTVTYSTTTILPARKCPSTLSKYIVIKPITDSNFYAVNPIICIDDTLHLIVNKPNKNALYTWDLGNGYKTKLNSENLNYVYATQGDFSIKLLAELENCKVSRTIENYIHVIPKPTIVDFTQSENEIDFYNPEIQFKSNTNSKYLYWSFGDGTYSNFKNPIHKFPETPGEYIIDLTASNMENNTCSKTVTRSIFMPEPVIYFVPNTFTPNGDELNNFFQPIFTFGYDPQNYSFYIYNRWGELLFESHDTKIGWDGTYGDKQVENDTYIWKLEFKEKLKENKHLKVGHVNVFK